MIASPIVTIVCITYNQRDSIKSVIEGFLMQAVNFPIEIIISDDSSDDGTSDLIREYARLHKKLITPIIRRQNIGQWQNLRESLSLAKGKYIAYCEGDDFWTDKNKLQKQFDFLEKNPSTSLVWTDIDIFHEKSGLYQRGIFENNFLKRYELFEEILINKPFLAPCTWMFKCEVADTFHKQSRDIVDGTFPFVLDLIAKGGITYLPFVSATYTKREESASNSQSFVKRHLFSKGVFRIQTEYASKYNVDRQTLNELKRNYYKSSWIYAFLSDDENSLKDAELFYETADIKKNKKNMIAFLIKFIRYSLKYNSSKRFMKALVSLTFQLYHYVQAKRLK
jgi:glycosyltransferase involved in cell wall biosynthesis